jgi:hypothetical protein
MKFVVAALLGASQALKIEPYKIRKSIWEINHPDL